MAKNTVVGHVRVKAYEVIKRAVEDGIAYGYRRAFKYTDKPSEDHITQEIERAVMNELCDVLEFDDTE